MSDRQKTVLLITLPAVAVFAFLVSRWWSRPPAIEFDNLKYVQLLTTAVSARSPDWLGKVEEAVQQRHRDGAMTARELASMSRIIAMADAGDWTTADRECFALAEAQLGRHRNRPAEHSHDH